MAIKLVEPADKPTLQDKRWQEIADSLPINGLAQVRATAVGWTTTIGALTGLFGLGLVVKSRTDLSNLSLATAVGVGVLSFLAVAAAGAAIWQGALAAQGSPSRLWDTAENVTKWYRTEAPKGSARLKRSRQLIFLSLVLLSASIGLGWYGPGKSSTTYLLVVTRSSGVYCGTTTNSAGYLLIGSTDKSQPQTRIPFSDVTTVTPVQNCP